MKTASLVVATLTMVALAIALGVAGQHFASGSLSLAAAVWGQLACQSIERNSLRRWVAENGHKYQRDV